MSAKQNKKALGLLFSLILFDIVGLGMILPLIPILSREFGAGGLKIGLIISAYSGIQFFLAPFWGRLSDLFGRKPIMALGLLGSSLSHIFFAFADSWGDVFLARIIAGLFGANTVTALAYIADRTPPQTRSRNIGLVGMAFGMGFSIGPVLGFFLIVLGEKISPLAPYGANFAALGAGFLCFANFVTACLFLRESLNVRPILQPKNLRVFFSLFLKKSPLFARPSTAFVKESLKKPGLAKVLLMLLVIQVALAGIEPVLILLAQDDFGWSRKTAYGSFIYIGLLMAFSQGYLVRRWIPRWGERALNQKSLAGLSIGFALIAVSAYGAAPLKGFFSPAFFALFLGVTLFSVGYSLSNTSLNGALSLLNPAERQGRIFGLGRSVASIARIIGPLCGGYLYQVFSHESPFVAGALLGLGAFGLSLVSAKSFPSSGRSLSLP